jgi:hypothetical protein
MKHLSLIASLFVLAFVPGCGCNIHHPGKGQKIGQIVKLSYGGVFRDTWEGQLIRGGLSDGSGTVGIAPFDFTVEDKALIPIIQGYMSNQTEVIITYQTEGIYSVLRSNSGGDFLLSIQPAKK